MGNTTSELSENTSEDIWWNPRSPTTIVGATTSTQTDPTPTMAEAPQQHQQSLADFKMELERKHEKRRQLIIEKRREMVQMKDDLEQCKLENLELRKSNEEVTAIKAELEKYKRENTELKRNSVVRSEFDALKEENEDMLLQVEKLKLQLKDGEEFVSKNRQLRLSIAEMQAELQNVNRELVNIEQERLEYTNHISALKDVIRVTKDMLLIRENQIEDLKTKITTVEEVLASKEMKIMSDGLREEYERQLKNIRNLRALYAERQRLDKKDKEHLQAQLDESKKTIEDEQKKNTELQERIAELENENSAKYDTIKSLQSNLGLSKAECKELQGQIGIINQLFSEVLLGFKNTQEIDLDKLIKNLEENHELLTNMATNEGSDSTAAALPKLLLDLINQMNKESEEACSEKENLENVSHALHHLNSAEEIVETLPKVWKVMIELLSHQTPPLNVLSGDSAELCYKSIETPTGPKLKLSVSQTFIRLKDLILEKKFLERETYRLKHLNTHLETRLQDQEKRLGLVSGELKTTWHVVDKMQRQHQQLHTHEKVLRYELHEKRKMLNELKQELQYCREKWAMARTKNDTTQAQWKELRKEFADRKNRTTDDFNQSAESGYSDAKDSSEDERGYESDVELEAKAHEECTAEDHSEMDTKTDELVQNDEKKRHSVAATNFIDVACGSTNASTDLMDVACGSTQSTALYEISTNINENPTNSQVQETPENITTPANLDTVQDQTISPVMCPDQTLLHHRNENILQNNDVQIIENSQEVNVLGDIQNELSRNTHSQEVKTELDNLASYETNETNSPRLQIIEDKTDDFNGELEVPESLKQDSSVQITETQNIQSETIDSNEVSLKANCSIEKQQENSFTTNNIPHIPTIIEPSSDNLSIVGDILEPLELQSNEILQHEDSPNLQLCSEDLDQNGSEIAEDSSNLREPRVFQRLDSQVSEHGILEESQLLICRRIRQEISVDETQAVSNSTNLTEINEFSEIEAILNALTPSELAIADAEALVEEDASNRANEAKHQEEETRKSTQSDDTFTDDEILLQNQSVIDHSINIEETANHIIDDVFENALRNIDQNETDGHQTILQSRNDTQVSVISNSRNNEGTLNEIIEDLPNIIDHNKCRNHEQNKSKIKDSVNCEEGTNIVIKQDESNQEENKSEINYSANSEQTTKITEYVCDNLPTKVNQSESKDMISKTTPIPLKVETNILSSPVTNVNEEINKCPIIMSGGSVQLEGNHTGTVPKVPKPKMLPKVKPIQINIEELSASILKRLAEVKLLAKNPSMIQSNCNATVLTSRVQNGNSNPSTFVLPNSSASISKTIDQRCSLALSSAKPILEEKSFTSSSSLSTCQTRNVTVKDQNILIFDSPATSPTKLIPEEINEKSSASSPPTSPKRTPEEILAGREARLKRLEEECKKLVTKVTNTSQKSVDISNKLDTLHETYGDGKNEEPQKKKDEKKDDVEEKK